MEQDAWHEGEALVPSTVNTTADHEVLITRATKEKYTSERYQLVQFTHICRQHLCLGAVKTRVKSVARTSRRHSEKS